MCHLPRRKGSGLGHLSGSGIETGTGNLPHLKIGSGIVQGIGVEVAAGLALVPGPSLQKGKVTLYLLRRKGELISDFFIFASSYTFRVKTSVFPTFFYT